MPSNLVLTGMANILGEEVVILVDAETGNSQIVTTADSNTGWRLIGVENSQELDKAVAVISGANGKNFRVAYISKRHDEINKKFANRIKATFSVVDTSIHSENQVKLHYSRIRVQLEEGERMIVGPEGEFQGFVRTRPKRKK